MGSGEPPLKGGICEKPRGRQPAREVLIRASRPKGVGGLWAWGVVREQQGASVPKEREERGKGFEDQCEKLDSILDASGGLGRVVHSKQTAHASTGWASVPPPL